MFLDIACLFIGRKKENLIGILDTYYPYADDKIDILVKRSLLMFNDRDEARMHDLLQDMGRKIARNNSPDEPGKHSRLWVRQEICDVLEKDKGTEAIEGILLTRLKPKQDDFFLSSSESDRLDYINIESFSTETLRRMTRLRFVYLDGISLTGKFKLTLEDLRWFCWNKCPLKCLSFEFFPQKLVILELPKSKLTTIGEVSEESTTTPYFRELTRLENLKTLNMAFSKDLTATPDFRRLPHLENLNLEGCESLKEVHISIGSLVRLVSLNLKGCVNLTSLPDTICNLGALEVLCIENCVGLEALPIEIGNIKSLKELIASGTGFLKLPDSIGDLSKVVKLKWSRCSLYDMALVSLPNTICNLRSLEILDISYSDTLERLPDQLWKLTSLLELKASYTFCLEKLPDIESSQTSLPLTALDLTASKITALPSGISQLSNLERLYLAHCHHLLSITELPPNLTYISAEDCTSLEILNLSNLKLLRTLRLRNCSALTEILGLEELTSLYNLDLQGFCRSALIHALTKPWFQIYSGFEEKIDIWHETEKFPDWIIPDEDRDASSSVNFFEETADEDEYARDASSSVNFFEETADEDGYASLFVNFLQPNLSHNYLGMILCFDIFNDFGT